MTMIADMLLAAGALSAAFYCFVLARRLKRFNNLEKGVGGAVAVLAVQVDELTKALKGARSAAKSSAEDLARQADRAEHAARKLELLIASLHDLPPTGAAEVPLTPVFRRGTNDERVTR